MTRFMLEMFAGLKMLSVGTKVDLLNKLLDCYCMRRDSSMIKENLRDFLEIALRFLIIKKV